MDLKKAPDVKVSVIIPVYRSEKYIERCAISLFKQTLNEIEFIFVDDNTPDKSMEIIQNTIKRYCMEEKVKVFHHDKNLGVSAARNTGLLHATGVYIGYCDSDDWVEPEMFKILYNSAMMEDADLSCCDIMFSCSSLNKRFCRFPKFDPFNKTQLLQNYISSGWNVLYNIIAKKSLYVQWNLKFPDDIGHCEDFYLSTLLLYYTNKCVYVDQVLYYYNIVNIQSITHNLNSKTQDDEIEVCRRLIAFFKSNNDFDLYKKQMSWRYLKAINNLLWDKSTHIKLLGILNTYPDLYKYMWSNPLLGKKFKLLLYLLVHKFKYICSMCLLLMNKFNFNG
jgi:glycosyltransferase involved in cell wall biosynthesis